MRRIILGLLLTVCVLVVAALVFVRVRLGSDPVRAAIEQQLEARLQQPVRVGSATASLFPRLAVELHDVSIGAPETARLDRLRIVTGLRALLSRRVEQAEIEIHRGRLPLPFALAPAASDPSGSGPSSSSFQVVSIRSIAVRDLTLAAGDQSLVLTLDSSLSQDRLTISGLTARAAKTEISASGTLDLARLDGALQARADSLDLDEMMALGSAMVEAAASAAGAAAPARAFHLTVKLTAASGTFSAYRFSGLATSIDVTPGRIALAPLSLGTFDGRVDGRVDIDTTGATPRLRLNGRLEGIDVAQLLTFSGSPGGLTGRLGGAVNLTGSGVSADALIKSARGTIDVTVSNGAMPGLDLVRTIVLAFGRPTGAPPEGSGAVFSRLGGRFALAGGTLASDNLAMSSRDVDLTGRGSLQIASGRVDARVNVLLSEDLTAQAGTDLRRYAQEDGRVVVPASISGTLQHPKVSPEVTSLLRRALGNELQRRTKSLIEGLFKKRD